LLNLKNHKASVRSKNSVPLQGPFRLVPESTRRIMRTQLVALLLPAAAAIWLFGYPALKVILIAVLTAGGIELAARKIKREKTPGSFTHSLMMGLLLSFTLPAGADWYIPLVGSVVAIGLGKHFFGGMGRYLWHPALIGRIVVEMLFHDRLALAFVGGSSWLSDFAAPSVGTTTAPLLIDTLRNFSDLRLIEGVPQLDCFLLEHLPPLEQCLIGRIPGFLGETCGVVIILVCLYFIYRGYVSWRLPAAFIGAAYLAAALCPLIIYQPEIGRHLIKWPIIAENLSVGLTYINYHIFTGGLILGGCLLAADMTSRPITRAGQTIFAAAAGVLTIGLRLYTVIPIPSFSAILVMNSLIGVIDRLTRPVGSSRPAGSPRHAGSSPM